MNKLYCPHCGEYSLVRDFYKPYYVKVDRKGELYFTDSEYEPDFTDSATQMYCEICWDFIKLEELEDQIENIVKEYKIKDLKQQVNNLMEGNQNE